MSVLHATADLLFLKGAHVETAAEEFYAIYKGEIIAQGTAKEEGKTLKKAMSATGKARLLGALDEALETNIINSRSLKSR